MKYILISLGALGILTGGFLWWQQGIVQKLPTEGPTFMSSTPEFSPVTTNTEDLRKFEQDIILLKTKRTDSILPTSTNQRSKEEMVNQPLDANSSFYSEPNTTISPSITPPPSNPTSSAPTPLPSSVPPLQQILLDGFGFCNYVKGNSSVILSGYPLAMDVAIPDANIKQWSDNRVVFTIPDSIPPGTYAVTVRGVYAWGYCTNGSSSPSSIMVK